MSSHIANGFSEKHRKRKNPKYKNKKGNYSTYEKCETKYVNGSVKYIEIGKPCLNHFQWHL
jgi:hypothetical protein